VTRWPALACFVLAASCGYPSDDDVETVFSKLRTERDESRREAHIYSLLNRLRRTSSTSESRTMDRAVRRLERYFVETKDVAALNAVDRVQPEGEFATVLCGFYQDMLVEPAFVLRYRASADRVAKLERCVGLSFSAEELDRRLNRDARIGAP
jgi:hypothetical protein